MRLTMCMDFFPHFFVFFFISWWGPIIWVFRPPMWLPSTWIESCLFLRFGDRPFLLYCFAIPLQNRWHNVPMFMKLPFVMRNYGDKKNIELTKQQHEIDHSLLEQFCVFFRVIKNLIDVIACQCFLILRLFDYRFNLYWKPLND